MNTAQSHVKDSLAIAILFITDQTRLDESTENYKNLQWCSSVNTPSFAFLQCSGSESHRWILLVMLLFILTTEEPDNTNHQQLIQVHEG